MTPDQVAVKLRQIADKIDSSTQPSLALVAADIRVVLNQVIDGGTPARQVSPAARRMAPSRQPEVDVSNPRAYQDARNRVASTK